MTDFYISDTHFGHENIIRHCNRPWNTVEEMDRDMIALWNGRVSKDDHVWHLGDFAYRNGRSTVEYLRALNGHKHLIVGNHDYKSVLKIRGLENWFDSVEYAVSRVDDQNRRMWMSHYPLACPPRRVWCLYGHVHNDTDWAGWDIVRSQELSLNCCADVNGYMPVTFEELISNNERWRLQG